MSGRAGLATLASALSLALASRTPLPLLEASGPLPVPAADAVVAADGSGDYRTVQEAINAVPQGTTAVNPWLIRIKPGTYHELVYVQREKRFVTLAGDDASATTVTYGLHANLRGLDGQPIGTFRTPTMVIDAEDFTVENLTVVNSAGPVAQALAVRVDGDRVIFRNTRLVGWQDTLFINRGRQYFEQTFIAGHVDFIFGGATAFFDRCWIHGWRDGYITAASTAASAQNGFVFDRCRVTTSEGARLYLGRPWRDFASVAFLRSELSAGVRSEGWHNWDRPEREKTTRYREFGSHGAGASNTARVPWARALSAADAGALTVDAVLGGADAWNPLRTAAHRSGPSVLDLPLPVAPTVAVQP